MAPFKLTALPSELYWHNPPVDWRSDAGDRLTVTAGPDTDWFIDPAGDYRKDSAPSALFTPPDENFLLSAKVSVSSASVFDAAVLQVRVRDDLWGKLGLEYSPQLKPTVVTVVTRGASDDCNSVTLEPSNIYLRVVRRPPVFGFHYSLDGRYWNLVRYFTLGEVDRLQVGLSGQSPQGQQCTVEFSEISYRAAVLADFRNGE